MGALIHGCHRGLLGRGDGLKLRPTSAPYHNLAVYGADVLDVLLLDADRIAKRLERRPATTRSHRSSKGTTTGPGVSSWRAAVPTARPAPCSAARAMGAEGLEGGASGPGIETLVVMLGANNAGDSGPPRRGGRLRTTSTEPTQAPRQQGCGNVWRPAHFADEWALLVKTLKSINARHVIVATVPQVMIAPIACGWRGKAYRGSRFFPYYIRPWINDADFDVDRDQHLTESESARSTRRSTLTTRRSSRPVRAPGGSRLVPVRPGRTARQPASAALHAGSGGAAYMWWKPYDLPPELTAMTPVPSTQVLPVRSRGRTDGGLFSLGGVHPTTIGYGVIAREVIRIMNDHARVPFFTPAGPSAHPLPSAGGLCAGARLRHAHRSAATSVLADLSPCSDGLTKRST